MISSDLDFAGAEQEPELDEKQAETVTDISPDSLEPQDNGTLDSTVKSAIRADDFQAMKEEYFKPPPDLEIESEGEYTWNITDWRELPRRLHSPAFEIGGHPWKILFFPFGQQPDFASFYLEQGHESKPADEWYACVQFMLVLWNANDPTIKVTHVAQHRFNGDESDWGFTRFVEIKKLSSGKFWNDTGRPLMEDEAANMTAYVRVIKDPTGVLWHSFLKYVPQLLRVTLPRKVDRSDVLFRFPRPHTQVQDRLTLAFRSYDSKKETGMVGLKNQGATCYLNSLIQSLYFTNLFRKAIYQIPTEEEVDPTKNSAYALQRLFYNLQTSDSAVSTTELTTAFGWDSAAIFQQQDVQELTRILMDKMEERMKDTEYATALKDMFRGFFKTYIDCINVDFKSERTEEFWDVQLDVRGYPTIYDSFKSYIAVEVLDGENKYQAEGFGLQDARKGVIFESFPPVLHCQLKRYEFDFNTLSQTKVHDRMEFPKQIDLAPYLSENADRSQSWVYNLHGVLVHSGDLDAGHYYAFIKPTKDGRFYRFDDDRVTPATDKEAMDENFGGEFAPQSNGFSTQQRNPYTKTVSKQRQMSAYMLVYIRENQSDQVLKHVTTEDIPAHLERKIQEERAEFERRRKEKDEAHLYMQVGFGTDADFQNHQGYDLFPAWGPTGFSQPGAVHVHRVLRTTTVGELRKLIASEVGSEEDLVRPWAMVGRQNLTLRPDLPLIWNDMRLEDTPSKFQAKLPLRYWVEVAKRKSDGTPDFISSEQLDLSKKADSPTLLFLKHFDVETQSLKGAGHLFISKSKKISDLGAEIVRMMGWPSTSKILLYEEIKSRMIDRMTNSTVTLAAAELGHGDIVCFQRELPPADAEALAAAGKYATPIEFYEYLFHRKTISFAERTAVDPSAKTFSLELSQIMTYDQIALRVGEHLQVEPTHLRFATLNGNMKFRAYVRKGIGNQTLNSILSATYSNYSGMTSLNKEWLYYEVLEMPLAELETKKLVKIAVLSEGIQKEVRRCNLVIPRGRS